MTSLRIRAEHGGLTVAVLAVVWLSGCRSPQAIARQEAGARWNTVRAQVKAQLAADQLNAGHVQAAAAELAEARRLDPQRRDLAVLEARLLLAGDRTAEAAALLESAPLDDADRPEAAYLLGIARQQQARWEEALAAFEQAAAARPDDVTYAVAAAQVRLQLGDATGALAFLVQRQSELGWTNAFQAALAECHEQCGDWSAAAAAWRRVAGRSDADAGLRERLALALFRAGACDEAIPVLESLVAADNPEVEALRVPLAECLLAVGRTAAAQLQVQTLLRNHPEHVPALLLLARCRAAQHDYAAGADVAARAATLAPQLVPAAELAAALAYRAGDIERVRFWTARLRALEPDNAVAARLLAAAARPG